MSELINYEKLDDCVKKYEILKEELDIDLNEEKLLLDILVDRLNIKVNRGKTNDYLSNIGLGTIGGLFKKTKKVTGDNHV